MENKVTALPSTTSDLSVTFTNRHLEPMVSAIGDASAADGRFLTPAENYEESHDFESEIEFPTLKVKAAENSRWYEAHNFQESVEKAPTDLSDAVVHSDVGRHSKSRRRRRSRTAESTHVSKVSQSPVVTTDAKSTPRHSFLADSYSEDSVECATPRPIQGKMESTSLRMQKAAKVSKLPHRPKFRAEMYATYSCVLQVAIFPKER